MTDNISYGHPDYNRMAQSVETSEVKEVEQKKVTTEVEEKGKKGFFSKKDTEKKGK